MKLLGLVLQSKIMVYMTKHVSTAARVIMLSAVWFTHICVRCSWFAGLKLPKKSAYQNCVV